MAVKKEKIAKHKSGGKKGVKLEAYGMIPVWPMSEVARVYGHGAAKYGDFNFLKGYNYTWSISALERHLADFKMGSSKDPDSGLHPLAAVVFHALGLMEFERRNVGTDDRAYKEKKGKK